mmetsp:Transcript_17047/g.13842  ORF Transcript_17047/g.13842 Transcript_17047/m.13842 type:complete len:87 (+) Transcript_17047:1-261(+)
MVMVMVMVEVVVMVVASSVMAAMRPSSWKMPQGTWQWKRSAAGTNLWAARPEAAGLASARARERTMAGGGSAYAGIFQAKRARSET